MDTISTMTHPTNSLPPKDRITVDSPPDWAKGRDGLLPVS